MCATSGLEGQAHVGRGSWLGGVMGVREAVVCVVEVVVGACRQGLQIESAHWGRAYIAVMHVVCTRGLASQQLSNSQ
jgi:hypothetical protein